VRGVWVRWALVALAALAAGAGVVREDYSPDVP
jgi:hypothetical protein